MAGPSSAPRAPCCGRGAGTRPRSPRPGRVRDERRQALPLAAGDRGAGQRRIHQRPDSQQVAACRPWWLAEVRLVDPEVIVALGATAGQALFGATLQDGSARGRVLEWPVPEVSESDRESGVSDRSDGSATIPVIATVHPSAVLRAPDRDELSRRSGPRSARGREPARRVTRGSERPARPTARSALPCSSSSGPSRCAAWPPRSTDGTSDRPRHGVDIRPWPRAHWPRSCGSPPDGEGRAWYRGHTLSTSECRGRAGSAAQDGRRAPRDTARSSTRSSRSGAVRCRPSAARTSRPLRRTSRSSARSRPRQARLSPDPSGRTQLRTASCSGAAATATAGLL